MFLTFSASDRMGGMPCRANIFLKQNLNVAFLLQRVLEEKGLSLGLDKVRQGILPCFVAVLRCI